MILIKMVCSPSSLSVLQLQHSEIFVLHVGALLTAEIQTCVIGFFTAKSAGTEPAPLVVRPTAKEMRAQPLVILA